MTKSPPSLPADHPSIGRSFDIPYEHSVECDLTTFPSSEAFTALCERHDLTETDTFLDVTPVGSYSSRSKVYHWYNDNVLLTTCCHPVTGERMHCSGRLEYREPGYASYLTLKGETDAVVTLYEDIVETVDHIKGGEVIEDRITPDGTHIQCEDRFPDRLQEFYNDEVLPAYRVTDE